MTDTRATRDHPAPEALPAPDARPGPRLRGLVWQTALLLCVLLFLAYLTQRYWPTVRDGAVRLTLADQGWLSVAAVAAVGTWAASALAQQGAVTERLPGVRLVAAQFAACAANHLLPAGIGAGAVNLRFLLRCGLPMGRSAGALAVKGGAGGVSRLALIALLVPFCPGLLRVPELPLIWLVGALGAAALVTAVAAGPLRPRCRRALTALLGDVRAVHARPARAVALWGGSLAFAALHCGVLVAVARAVALPLPAPEVALLYLAASGAAALLPTPGGLGSLDAALVLALTTSGAPAATAASAVLGYRMLTVWLPLPPGLLTLAVLLRRKAL
ncbi:lysylphosphatidylglycerol synthase domain-containing protein [Streptomyces sp. NPDC090119]|uniref:lysylphosphatidylglycerol synthase domain-containing protein n=1 Tax=Streptomyces sp. NPDC090119 TaxID=3365951 RepID=UPI0037F73555